MELTAITPDERVRKALDYGSQIHPQYPQEFDNGVAVAWHRSPFTMGCFGMWTDHARAKHYEDLCGIDGRIALAGEKSLFMSGCQEGGVPDVSQAGTRLPPRSARARGQA